MSRPRSVNEIRLHGGDSSGGSPNLGDLLTARPSGLTEPECWAILCQAVQALQDLFLSDGASSDMCIPLVTPSTLMLSSRGRVKLCQSNTVFGCGPPVHLTGYLAPEYRPNKHYTDTEAEKLWIYALGETLKRAALTSHAATLRLSNELYRVLADMTKTQPASRASLMHLLDVISEYCKRRQQNRPFSHIVMDLHQEAMAAIETRLDTPWGPPAMPELRPRTRNRSETTASETIGTIPRRWINLTRNNHHPDSNLPKVMKEASTSMEDISHHHNIPGAVMRPKSMCISDFKYFQHNHRHNNDLRDFQYQAGGGCMGVTSNSGGGSVSSAVNVDRLCECSSADKNDKVVSESNKGVLSSAGAGATKLMVGSDNYNSTEVNNRRLRVRRNPVQRAASRLYRATTDMPIIGDNRDCIGPEFVVRAALPSKHIVLTDSKGGTKKTVTVIMLNGQKLDVMCNPNTTTAGELFEAIIQKEPIEENFMLGLSALIAGDFVFLPSDTRICKAIQSDSPQNTPLTLFVRVRFFLPTLRGIRSAQARHLLYLQLRRSILEHQLPCSFLQLIELNGLALQAEFGNFNEKEHGTRDYFLMEHYVPETMSCMVESQDEFKQKLILSHISKRGFSNEKAKQDFIILAQSLPHYGGHFYTATWILKDNNQKDVWLYISAQGINLYRRDRSTSTCGPQLYEIFEWRSIQTLCYSKHYLCVLPHSATLHSSKLKKYKLKMDHKKSYFTFRLASLHHQFFLRLRTEYTSLQTLSTQFGIPLKDMKNESNSLCKLEALTNPENLALDQGTVNAETEFKIEFRASSKCSSNKTTTTQATTAVATIDTNNKCRRAKSIHDISTFNTNDYNNINNYYYHHQNKENENPIYKKPLSSGGLVLDSSCLSGLISNTSINPDKRSGVKMGTRMFTNSNLAPRISRSMEAVNAIGQEEYEDVSLQSVSLNCSSTSISKSPTNDGSIVAMKNEAYILDASIESEGHQFLPDFQESLSETLLEKFDNISFAEERIMSTIRIERDSKGSLGLQITEGSDGNVYVQSVIPGGPAHLTNKVLSGDQVIAVNGKSLLGMKYCNALKILTNTGHIVEFLLSRRTPTRSGNIHSQSTLRLADLVDNSKNKINLSNITEKHLKTIKLENTMNKLKRISYPNNLYSLTSHQEENLEDSPIEKHVFESCHDFSNIQKYNSSNSTEVPYHKHIRYEIEPEMTLKQLPASSITLNKNISKSCTQIFVLGDSKLKTSRGNYSKFQSLDRQLLKSLKNQKNLENNSKPTIPPIALPRSLGLSRKWRGPVRYPVTPVKKTGTEHYEVDSSCTYLSTSDDEQVFI